MNKIGLEKNEMWCLLHMHKSLSLRSMLTYIVELMVGLILHLLLYFFGREQVNLDGQLNSDSNLVCFYILIIGIRIN